MLKYRCDWFRFYFVPAATWPAAGPDTEQKDCQHNKATRTCGPRVSLPRSPRLLYPPAEREALRTTHVHPPVSTWTLQLTQICAYSESYLQRFTFGLQSVESKSLQVVMIRKQSCFKAGSSNLEGESRKLTLGDENREKTEESSKPSHCFSQPACRSALIQDRNHMTPAQSADTHPRVGRGRS